MTIKTLKYIHRVLIDAERTSLSKYEEARRLQQEYEESEWPTCEFAKNKEAHADRLMVEHRAAVDALTDFESQEW